MVLQKLASLGEGRSLKKLQGQVDAINAFEPVIEELDAGGLAAKTVEFRARLADGEDIDDLLPEAFASVR